MFGVAVIDVPETALRFTVPLGETVPLAPAETLAVLSVTYVIHPFPLAFNSFPLYVDTLVQLSSIATIYHPNCFQMHGTPLPVLHPINL